MAIVALSRIARVGVPLLLLWGRLISIQRFMLGHAALLCVDLTTQWLLISNRAVFFDLALESGFICTAQHLGCRLRLKLLSPLLRSHRFHRELFLCQGELRISKTRRQAALHDSAHIRLPVGWTLHIVGLLLWARFLSFDLASVQA